MKVLAVSDQVVPGLYGPNLRQQFGDVDMVISCGDLPYSYLEYIASTLNGPCFLVHGNHDGPEYLASGETLSSPGGWDDLDERAVYCKGLILGGLAGSIQYHPGRPYQYTQGEMTFKAIRMLPTLLINRLRYGRCLDVLVTHSPPLGIHNGTDAAHQGFRVFLRLMALFRPRYLLHGHQHSGTAEAWRTRYLGTDVINVYPFQVLEW